jgi:hypothetical protein
MESLLNRLPEWIDLEKARAVAVGLEGREHEHLLSAWPVPRQFSIARIPHGDNVRRMVLARLLFLGRGLHGVRFALYGVKAERSVARGKIIRGKPNTQHSENKQFRQSSSGVEQGTHKPLVGGSNPSSGTRRCNAQLSTLNCLSHGQY